MVKYKSMLLALLATFIISFSGLFAKLIHSSASTIIMGRSLVGVIGLIGVSLFLKSSLKIKNVKDAILIFVIGGFMAFHWVTIYISIKVSTIAVGTILLFTYPFLTAILEPFFRKRKIDSFEILMGVLIIIGVFTLNLGEDVHGNIVLGVFFGFMSAFSNAMRNILVKPLLKSYSPINLMFYQLLVSTIVLFPFEIMPLIHAPINDLLLIILAGLLLSTIGHTIYVYSLKELTATTVGFIASLGVIEAVFLGWLVLNEKITLSIIGGGTLILMSVVAHIIYLSRRKN